MPAKVVGCTWLVFLFHSLTALALATNPQGDSLLSWKQTLRASPEALSDWDARDPTPCRWHGISCDARGLVAELRLEHVDLFGPVPANLTALAPSLLRLVLTGTNLSGPIPPTLGTDFPLLQLLDLSDNALTGTIPGGGLCLPDSRLVSLQLNSNRLEGPIPDSIGNLTRLQWLILYDNQLDGAIPPTVGRMAALRVLRAGGNKNLQGTLPREIGNCSRLEMLGLAETSISGELPASLGQLGRLQTLAVYTALLSGAIPPELGECGELENIYLYENSITGSIPAQLGRLGRLKNLLVWQNNLVGIVPAELGCCSELSVIDLSMNGLTGPIPAALGNLSSSLQELQLSVNQVSGQIPKEIANCGSLTDLELDNNLISGTIPPELGRLGNLRMLYLWENRLVGSIPAEIGRCTNLEAVDLSQNALTGAVPREVFALPRLAKLLLLSNDLSGEIPPEIGNCSSLIRLRANLNRIAGRIPAEIGNLKNLSFLDLGSNRISGPLPAEIAGCRNLTFVDLHSNSISGELPERVFEGLILLQYLDLSNNSIAGELPADLGMLTSLTKLILGGNRFSGEIPAEIGSCSRLQLLDLGENSLSGEIPASLGNIPALEIGLNLSGNGLSGPIPAEFSGLVRLSVLDISHNRLSGDLRSLSALQNLVSLNVSYNNFSGRLPSSPFFSKLPVADLEANPSLCFSQCSSEKVSSKSPILARTATAVLLVVAALLLISAVAVIVCQRTRGRNALADREKDGELSSPWEVTLYQKSDIVIADVARSLVAANAVGHGWSGTVYRVPIPLSGSAIAVKRFRVLDEMGVAAFESEIGVLSRIRHRNIVRLLGWAANSRTRLLLYNYLPNGTLGSLLHDGGVGGAVVEWEVRLGIAVGVAEGLAYLHHDCVPGIIHRDVKSENVLLGERYEVCLADFGLARVVEEETGGSTAAPFAGSYGYIAPEYGCMKKITKKSDVYSFGVLLLEIITGRKPATDPSFPEGQSVVQWVRDHLRNKGDPAEVVDSRLQGRPDAQVQEMLQALGIALLCASNRPDDRPTMKDVAALLREIRHIDSPGASSKASGGGWEPQKLATSNYMSLAYSSSGSNKFK